MSYAINKAYNASDVARLCIKICNAKNNPVSNLHLQKILYYLQAQFMINGTVCFSDPIVAWEYGPAVEKVYRFPM